MSHVSLIAADPFHYLLGRRFTRPPGDSRAPRMFEKSHPFAVAVADVLSTVAFLLAVHAGASLL